MRTALKKLKNSTIGTWVTWHEMYGKLIPQSNTGLTMEEAEVLKEAYAEYPLQETKMLLTDQGAMPVLFRRPSVNEVCVIDWLNVTIKKSTYDLEVSKVESDIDPYLFCFARDMERILGISLGEKLSKGINFYEETYKLDKDCGFISIGGQRDTILLTLNGTGCTLANYYWECFLKRYLEEVAHGAKITRIDLAFDDLESEIISVDWADEQDNLGGFRSHYKQPRVERLGDWKRPELYNKGRTLNVGRRDSSKFCRIYEKGKQLGDKSSVWTRLEVEYKAKHYHIPLDILENPSCYFLASYPCLSVLDEKKTPLKLNCIKRRLNIDLSTSISTIKHQFGKYIRVLRTFFNDDSEVLNLIESDKLEFPKRLKLMNHDYYRCLSPVDRLIYDGYVC